MATVDGPNSSILRPVGSVVRNTVHVGGLSFRTVSTSRQATHEQLLHAVSVERLEDPIRIERATRLVSHEYLLRCALC
jgi:hypothetical protein